MSSCIVRPQKVMRNRIEEVKPLLDVEEPFTIKDVENEDGKVHNTLKLLHEHQAIKKIELVKDNGHRIGKWEWREEEKREIEEWLEKRSMFPCGHKATVYNPEWADELACKTCGEEYTKEQVREWL